MKRKFILSFIVFTYFHFSFGQVINIESMRKATDSAKWTGSVSLDFGLIKNTSKVFRVASKAFVQYNNKKQLWLFINDLNFQKIEGNSFVNKGTQHLRYNYTIAPKTKIEAFAQAQYDAISEIDFRGLLGVGPRFKLTTNDNYKVYIGTLVMYEYEKASDVVTERIQRDVRASTYLSFSLYPTENITIVSTSYFQPKLESFADYRIANDTSLILKLFDNLAFKSSFSYNYDAKPVIESIPKTQYELTNGLLYTF